MLEAGQLCVHMFPWKRWNVTNVNKSNKSNKSYMRTAEMKSSEAWSTQLMYFIYICRISCLSREHREAVSLNQKRYLNSFVRLSLLRCTSLCVRHGLTLVSNVCAAYPCPRPPNGLNKLPEVCINFPFTFISKSTMAFLTGQSWCELKSLQTGGGPEEGFQRCFKWHEQSLQT